MAILKFGTLIVGARGTLGGATLSANRSGPYAKTWSRGSNPRSAPQTSQRSNLSVFAIAWRSLLQSQRDGWNTYAALPEQELTNSLGEPYFVSGFNWYVGINLNLRQAAQPRRDDAPLIDTPAAPVLANFFLKTDAAPTNTRVELSALSPQVNAFHAVDCDLVYSTGITAGFSNLPHMLTAIPTNSAPVPLVGVPTVSSFFPGFPAANLTDGNTATTWFANSPIIIGWAQLTFAATQVVSSYRWFPSPAGGGNVNPAIWTLEYWDGLVWQIHDTQTNPPFMSADWNTFYPTPAPTSALWRINITQNRGSAAFMGMNELEMFITPVGAKDIAFQAQIQTKFGAVVLGQRAFVSVRTQNAHGRRGPAVTAFADAEAV